MTCYLPSENTLRGCMLNMSADCGGIVSSCAAVGQRNLVMLDHACCGCGHGIQQQNIWHLMTRAFTVWFSMRALNMSSADVFFTRRRPYGNVSTQLWTAVVGGGQILSRNKRVCNRKLTINRMSQGKHMWLSTEVLPVDRLWTLAKHPRECSPQQQTVFRQFVRHVARGVGVSMTRPNGSRYCFLSRGAAGSNRREHNLNELHRLLPQLHIMHLDAHTDLKDQIEQVMACRAIVGLHGAHMMHAMWLSPGTVVHEIHTIQKTKNYYYRNIALLAGARYVSHSLCKHRCIARIKEGRTWIDPNKLASLLNTSGADEKSLTAGHIG